MKGVVSYVALKEYIRGYHHFPKNEAQRQTWLKHCGLKAENVKENDKICFRHFKPDDYLPRRSDNQVRILKKFIVPTRNLPKVSQPQTTVCTLFRQ